MLYHSDGCRSINPEIGFESENVAVVVWKNPIWLYGSTVTRELSGCPYFVDVADPSLSWSVISPVVLLTDPILNISADSVPILPITRNFVVSEKPSVLVTKMLDTPVE